MKYAMCNELCEDWKIAEVFRLAAEVGYEGVEIAPFTIAESVAEISQEERRRIRASAKDHGVRVAGLHWLLASPKGLYTNHPDAALREKTRRYFEELIHFCADLGGARMVIGSPKQRDVIEGESYEDTWKRTVDFYRQVSPVAGDCDVVLGMEPLGRRDTNFLNTKDEVIRLIEEVSHANFRLTLDCKAMADEHGVILNQHQSYQRLDTDEYTARLGCPPLVHFAKIGLLARNCTFAHVNILVDDEVPTVLESGMSIVWCPMASMLYGVGGTIYGRHLELYKQGANIALGCDSANWTSAFDIGEQAFIALLTARVSAG